MGERYMWVVVTPWSRDHIVGVPRITQSEAEAAAAEIFRAPWREIQRTGYRCVRATVTWKDPADG